MKLFTPILITLSLFTSAITAQTGKTDSAQALHEVVVRAYQQNRQLKEVGAAINYIGRQQLERYNNTNILPALNATPGVHMEERSPGSYRLNVRGSTLRSPFGVRNVKVYWNGIPFTDPGGNTYLNQLSYYNVNSIEVIKGPASSLYGAGTGGAVLISSQPASFTPGTDLRYVYGSFNTHNISAQVRTGNDDTRNVFGYTRQTSDGYRDHTNMRRDVATWESQMRINDRQQLTASVLYGDLYYETPGALTEAQYNANPRSARLAAGMFPSADGAQAAIYQKTFLAGVTHDYRFTEHFQNSTVVYGAFSNIKNPTFRNYERRSEPHFGGRSVFTWQARAGNTHIQTNFGAEAQRGFFNVKTFRNLGGQPDTVQTDDDVDPSIYSAFVQTDIYFPGNWSLSAGVSFNKSSIAITRLTGPQRGRLKANFDSEWAPRVALSKKIMPGFLVYASVARGFSPPSTGEILPSNTIINSGLQAEHGVNYEGGIKTSWLQQRLYVEVNAFYYQLKNAIVQRGADYFENAGSTKQQGIESQASYQLLPKRSGFITDARVFVSHTWNKFRYREFKVVANDFSGKKLPSVASNTVAAGLDLTTRVGWYINLTWFYSDPVPVNDANTAYASSYHLAGGRTGWRLPVCKKMIMDLFAGIDNAFDVTYSPGSDINATGNRFFNAAPGVNYYAGVALQFRCASPK